MLVRCSPSSLVVFTWTVAECDADLSIVPENVGANTNNTALMIGEKAADIIIRELGLGSSKEKQGQKESFPVRKGDEGLIQASL